MRIFYVGGDVGTGNYGDLSDNANPNPVTWPAGIRPGDFALVAWAFSATVGSTNPSGFDQLDAATNGNQQAKLLGRVCDGSENGVIPFVNAELNKQAVTLGIYRGTHKVAPVLSADITLALENSPSTTHTAPSETLNVADCGVVTVMTERGSPATQGFTVPSGYVKRLEAINTGGGATTVTLADDGLTTGRPPGAVVSPGTWTGNSSQNNIMWTVLLRPRQYEGWGVDL